MNSPKRPDVPPPPRERRRFLRRTLVTLGVILGSIAVLALVAFVAAEPIARRLVERDLESRLAVTARMDDLSLSPSGRAQVRGLELVDLEGRAFASVETLDATVDLRRLLSGSFDVVAAIVAPTLYVRQDDEGRWNVAEVLRETEEDEPDEPSPPTEREVALAVELTRGRVVVEAGGETFELTDVTFTLDADSLGEPGSFRLSADALDGGEPTGEISAEGTVTLAPPEGATPSFHLADLSGELHYVPDRVARLLGPTLPGELVGSEREEATFRVSGEATRLEPEAILAGLQGEARAGLGRYQGFGLDLAGTVHATLEGGQLALTGDLAANGGTLDLATTLPLVGEGATRLTFELAGAQANAGLAPMLGHVHPAFAGLDAVKGGALAGLVEARLELESGTPITPMQWADLDEEELADVLAGIRGTGRLALRELTLEGSPFLGEALAALGLDSGRSFSLQPLVFEIDGGRLRYDQPWRWDVAGAETTFGGSVGLDGSLDLVWKFPIEGELASHGDLLGALRGTTLELPISGTATDPRLEWRGLIEEAVEGALRGALDDQRTELEESVREKITEELGDELGGGLDRILGGKGGSGDEGKGGGGEGGGAADLLKEADRLWEAGEREPARELYRKIRAEFPLSPTYLLNRDRIKERGR